MNSMKFKAKGSRMLQAAMAGLFAGVSLSAGAAIDLTGQNYVLYGDAASYLLGVQTNDPLYVSSSPGQLQNYIVVATGSGPNTGINNSIGGMDNPYETPTSGNGSNPATNYYSISSSSYRGTTGTVSNNLATTWDSSLSSMETYLAGNQMVFFFNNNQTNNAGEAAQSLAAWAQVWITQGTTIVGDVYQLTNQNSNYGVFPNNGGTLNGDPSSYTNTVIGNPIAGTNSNTDYVLAGGSIGGQSYNLGANQAAYGVIFPELNALMASLFSNNALDLTQYTLHVDLRLGCDPAFSTQPTLDAVCRDGNAYYRSLDNGYEQLFIGAAAVTPPSLVPEPGSMALAGLALMGIFGAKRRARRG